MMGDLRVEAVTRTTESPLGSRSQSVTKRKLPTGEPYAGKPPVRFGGRGGESLPYPYRASVYLCITTRSGAWERAEFSVWLKHRHSGRDAGMTVF